MVTLGTDIGGPVIGSGVWNNRTSNDHARKSEDDKRAKSKTTENKQACIGNICFTQAAYVNGHVYRNDGNGRVQHKSPYDGLPNAVSGFIPPPKLDPLGWSLPNSYRYIDVKVIDFVQNE
ncbi:MAG: hypothetical protein A2052_03865 [Deltaproteobacteria bacterium GWA2_54_12]|nr:MAG: hypothetical protein A2052_03865 [Deltaproteobacteria bacterium GWA2_54_12]